MRSDFISNNAQIDEKTGMLINITELKKVMQDKVLSLLDHHNIVCHLHPLTIHDHKDSIDYFKTRPSTAENISVFIYEQMQAEFGKLK